MKQELHVSLVQTSLHWEKIDANLAMFEEVLSTIEKTDLIVLPEMFTTGFTMNPENVSEPEGGKTFKWIRIVAKKYQAAVCGSYIVKINENYYNRLLFVLSDGTARSYDKRHLFSLVGEDQKYTAGKERLVVEYLGWKIAPFICYDLRFPVWSRSQYVKECLYEYDLIVFVANWPTPRIKAWDTLLAARSIENMSYGIGVNRIGIDAIGHEYAGHSEIYDYTGEAIGTRTTDQIITATLNKSMLDKFRSRFNFQREADRFKIL